MKTFLSNANQIRWLTFINEVLRIALIILSLIIWCSWNLATVRYVARMDLHEKKKSWCRSFFPLRRNARGEDTFWKIERQPPHAVLPSILSPTKCTSKPTPTFEISVTAAGGSPFYDRHSGYVLFSVSPYFMFDSFLEEDLRIVGFPVILDSSGWLENIHSMRKRNLRIFTVQDFSRLATYFTSEITVLCPWWIRTGQKNGSWKYTGKF